MRTEKYPVMVIVLRARKNTDKLLKPLVPKVIELLTDVTQKERMGTRMTRIKQIHADLFYVVYGYSNVFDILNA